MKVFIKCPECGDIHIFNSNRYHGSQHNCPKCERWFLSDEIPSPLKAISIKQPWAWLIVNGYKDLENRNTLKNFRGICLIHASKSFDYNWFSEDNNNYMNIPKHIDRGGIIGAVTITDSIQESDSPWFIGKNAFVLTNPIKLPFTPCKGKLSFFTPKID